MDKQNFPLTTDALAGTRSGSPLEGQRGGAKASVPVVGLFVLAVFFTLYLARSLLLPIVLAVLFSLLLSPAVRSLKKLRIPEPFGAAIVVLALVAGAGTAAYLLTEPAADWMERAPRILGQLDGKLRDVKRSVLNMKQATDKVEAITRVDGDKKPREVIVQGPSLGGIVLSKSQYVIGGFVATTVLIYFLLASGDLVLRKVVRVIPRLRDKIRAVEVGREIQRQVGRYFMVVSLSNAALGVATAICLYFLDMPNPGLWGVVAATLHFIPYVGSSVTCLILTVVALLTFDDVARVWPIPTSFLFLTILEGQVLQPIVAGRQLSLNPVVIFVSLLFWGWMWGIAGMLISVPILVTLKIFCDHIERLHPVGEFLGRE